MEFITVEQFKEQPKEVQKVFLDWWEPSVGDIFQFETVVFNNDDSTIGVIGSKRQIKIVEDGKGEYRMPLFTEGQTRRFIEDKTNTDTILGLSDCKEYIVALIKNDDDLYKTIDTKETNLLQAYWKVACMIAKEAVDE